MLEEKMKGFIERLDTMKENILTEEETKTSLIMNEIYYKKIKNKEMCL